MRAIFGYVRVFKPQLRICEYDTYKAVYCGLCKQIGKSYGLVPRFALSYDFAFLTLLGLSLGDCNVTAKSCRCIAHPLKKRPCAFCEQGFEYPAAAAQILIYHKLRDDVADKGLLKKCAAGIMLFFMKKGYNKAKGDYPQLADRVERLMKIQLETERKADCSIDEAAQPSAEMMQEIAAYLADDERIKRALRRFGYCIGRYVYLCDAADDLCDDIKKKSFNPLVKELDIKGSELTDKQREQAIRLVAQSVNLTLSELADCYVLLDIQKYKPILDNIIYMGLKNTCFQILNTKLKDTDIQHDKKTKEKKSK